MFDLSIFPLFLSYCGFTTIYHSNTHTHTHTLGRTHTHTHTHTHIYIYIYIQIWDNVDTEPLALGHSQFLDLAWWLHQWETDSPQAPLALYLHNVNYKSKILITLIYIYIYIPRRMGWKVHWEKNSYEDMITTSDDCFDQKNTINASPTEELCGPQWALCWNIDLIWSQYMSLSWSANKPFSPT